MKQEKSILPEIRSDNIANSDDSVVAEGNHY